MFNLCGLVALLFLQRMYCSDPRVQQSITVFDGTDVDLGCFIKPERELPQSVFWTRNGKRLISHDDTSNLARVEGFLTSRKFNEEEFHLSLTANVNESGKYQCWYTTGESDHPKLGLPESYTLTVMKRIIDAVVDLDETSTDDWMNLLQLEETTAAETIETSTDHLPVYLELSSQTMQDAVNGVGTTGFPTKLLPVFLEESTHLIQDVGNLFPKDLANSQQTEAIKEKETFSDKDNLDITWNVFQLQNFPWVRTGLIGGVLLITAVVLCVLRALRHI